MARPNNSPVRIANWEEGKLVIIVLTPGILDLLLQTESLSGQRSSPDCLRRLLNFGHVPERLLQAHPNRDIDPEDLLVFIAVGWIKGHKAQLGITRRDFVGHAGYQSVDDVVGPANLRRLFIHALLQLPIHLAQRLFGLFDAEKGLDVTHQFCGLIRLSKNSVRAVFETAHAQIGTARPVGNLDERQLGRDGITANSAAHFHSRHIGQVTLGND